MICFVRSASSIVLIKPLVCKAARLACGQRARSGYVSGTSVQLGGHPLRVYCSPMRRTISIVGALALVACGVASESEELFDDGAGGRGSSGALTPDDDSGAEGGAAGEDGARPAGCAPRARSRPAPAPAEGRGRKRAATTGPASSPASARRGMGETGEAGGAGATAEPAAREAAVAHPTTGRSTGGVTWIRWPRIAADATTRPAARPTCRHVTTTSSDRKTNM